MERANPRLRRTFWSVALPQATISTLPVLSTYFVLHPSSKRESSTGSYVLKLRPTGEYRFIDSTTRISVTHKPTNTKLRVLSSNGRTAFGIVGTPLLVADEPGSWEIIGGGLLHDAVITALGKPGSPLRCIFIGTLAPATSGWWHDLIADGSGPTTYVPGAQG